jgi:hypothetical protein
MIQNYDGAQVEDANGDTVGTVYRTYDDAEGRVRYVLVDLSSEGKRLIPAENAEWRNDTVRIPWDREAVAGSPDASQAGDTLEGTLLDEVRSFYAGDSRQDEVTSIPASRAKGSESDSSPGEAVFEGPAADQTTGQVRDLGDVVEIPIIEEVVVKKPVVKEVLRVRKRQVVEQDTVQGEVRREDVEVTGLEGNQTSK